MKKKFAVLILATMLVLSSCGSESTSTSQSTEKPKEISIEQSSVPASTNEKDSTDEYLNKEIDIILYAYIWDDSGIDSYVESLKESNPDGNYSVYNDEYYSMTITEGERLEFLEGFFDGAALEEVFSTLKNDETYGGTILDIKYDDSFQNLEVYVDKEKYDANKFVYSFGIGLILQSLSDTYQAYNLIMPADRVIEIKIIDNPTGKQITE